MYSIAFPEMFKSNGTQLVKDKEATKSNLHLLLLSWKTSLFGDPYFGTLLKTFLYEPNNIILRDLVIDEIYTSTIQFIPQLYIERKNIKVEQRGVDLFATINCINKIDNEVNAYEIQLTENT